MIISHKHKFIFIKTNKTAGTSVEIALSMLCGPHDIITPVSPKDEKVRRKLGARGPQHYRWPLRELRGQGLYKLLVKGMWEKRFFNHMGAELISEHIDKDVWDSYYKFCIERNPWDRVVSFYYWAYKDGKRPDFETYIHGKKIMRLKRRGIGLYTIDGEVIADRICRFERLREDLDLVRKDLGIEDSLELPRTKVQTQKKKAPYQDYYTDTTRQRVAELFDREIDLMDYRFDPKPNTS